MRYLRAKQVAKEKGVSESTIWRWVRDGTLPQPIKVTTRTTLFPVEEVDAAIERLRDGAK